MRLGSTSEPGRIRAHLQRMTQAQALRVETVAEFEAALEKEGEVVFWLTEQEDNLTALRDLARKHPYTALLHGAAPALAEHLALNQFNLTLRTRGDPGKVIEFPFPAADYSGVSQFLQFY